MKYLRYLVGAAFVLVPVVTFAPGALGWVVAHYQGLIVVTGCVVLWTVRAIWVWDGE